MLLLKDYKSFWITNFLTIYKVPPPLKKIRLSNGITRKKTLIFSGDPIWEPDFFLVIKFDVQIFFRWQCKWKPYFFRWYLCHWLKVQINMKVKLKLSFIICITAVNFRVNYEFSLSSCRNIYWISYERTLRACLEYISRHLSLAKYCGETNMNIISHLTPK